MDIKTNTSQVRKCKHVFHKLCILQIFEKVNPKCPNCRNCITKSCLVDTMYYYQPKNITVNISTPSDPVNRSVSKMKKPPAPVNRSVSRNVFDYNGIWMTPLEYKFLPNPRITLK